MAVILWTILTLGLIGVFPLSLALRPAATVIRIVQDEAPEMGECVQTLETTRDEEAFAALNFSKTFQYFEDIPALKNRMEEQLPENFPYENLTGTEGIWFFNNESSNNFYIVDEFPVLKNLTMKFFLSGGSRARINIYKPGGFFSVVTFEGSNAYNWENKFVEINNKTKVRVNIQIHSAGFALLDNVRVIRRPHCSFPANFNADSQRTLTNDEWKSLKELPSDSICCARPASDNGSVVEPNGAEQISYSIGIIMILLISLTASSGI